MSLTADEIFNRPNKWKTEKVSVPEWGEDGHVYVRSLPAIELGNVQTSMPGEDADLPAVVKGFAKLCVLFVCNKDANPLFTDDQAASLEQEPIAVIQRCAEAGLALNGLSGGADEDLEGNSESIPPDASPSD
jgi:hypothetical protein